MRHETQVDLIHRFLKLRGDRANELAPEPGVLDVAVYTDPDRAARERQVLFRDRPLVAALSGDLPDTGDCVTVELGEVPVLLVRGEDGHVRAFLNACRHRGSRVAEGHGHAGRTFTCPYHAWTYDIHGRLLGQPLADKGFAGLDRARLGLIPLPVGEAAGLVLVHPGRTAPADLHADAPPQVVDVEAWLEGLAEELGEWDFAGHRFFDERVMDLDCSWKLAYDTFLEGYHIFSLHSRTVGKGLLSTPVTGDRFGRHNRGVVHARTLAAHAEAVPEDRWDLKGHSSIVYQLFPNVLINLPLSGHAELWQIYPHPSDPGRSRAHLRFYTPGPVAEDDEERRAFFRRNLDFTAQVVLVEDFGQQEAIQRTLDSGLLPAMHHGRNEPALQAWHRDLQTALDEG